MSERKTVTSTDSVHTGDERRKAYDSVPMSIVQTSTYSFADTAEIVAHTEGGTPTASAASTGATATRPCAPSSGASPRSRARRTPLSSRAAWPR